ncbi:MAG: Holliday junction branch migration protein RuvA [Planctomycetota bacterium]
MLEYLKGRLVSVEKDRVIVEVSDFGFEIIPTKQLLNSLPAGGSCVVIYVYAYYSEEGIKIFGFASPTEKSLFLDLISVPDIGPSRAIKILGSVTIATLIESILSERLDILSEIPGVGIKSAKKLITFLKEKFVKYKELEGISYYNIDIDIKKALKQLGYKDGEINMALDKIDRKRVGDNLEQAIKECIDYLSRR